MAFHGILTHEEREKLLHIVFLAKLNLVKAHFWAYKVNKLLRRNFSQTFESGYLGIVTKFVDCGNAFLVGVAVVGLHFALLCLASGTAALALGIFAVQNTEQRGLKNLEVASLYKFGIELKEIGEQKQSDVHAINISIGSNDYLVVTQALDAVIDIEGSL